MIAIIGGGISGLSLGWHLQKKDIPYKIFEASAHAGGNIKSEKIGDYLIERGPNSILADTELIELIKEIGLEDNILYPQDVSKNRYIFKKGKYQKLPAGPAFLFSNFFSLNAKLSVFKEYNKKSQGTENESVADFFERRFCKEIVEYAVNPFVAGIYAGDPNKLLVRKTFPQLYELEKEYGSVIKGFLKTRKSTSRKVSFSFKNGMQELPNAIAEQVNIEYTSKIESINKNENGNFVLATKDEEIEASKLVFSLPSFSAAQFLESISEYKSDIFNAVPYPKMYVIHTAFKKATIGWLPNGFGGLHPKKEGLFTAGSIWSSSLFPSRCPNDEFLFTSFVGGSQFEQQASEPKEVIQQKVTEELQKLYSIKAQPVFQELTYWENAIPQYTVETEPAHEALEELQKEGIYHCTNWKDGVSVADCLKKGKELAEKLAKSN